MSSTFKNVIPRRKYRERVQPAGREHLGFLQKKKDYKQRAKNYHQKQDMINKLKVKASTKNQDEFYFKMLKGRKNQDGKHIEQDQESDFDEKQYRSALKTQNYSIVSNQRSIVQKKIQRLRSNLQLISEKKPNTHIIFADDQEQFNNFVPHEHFKTSKELLENNMLEINPTQISKQQINYDASSTTLKNKYTKLSEYIKKQQMLTKLLLKIGYEKNLLGKQRKMIKKNKKDGTKVHKFFMQRKK